jgi:ABC-type branched-subunit amino acid transport system permease subunit
MNTFKGYVFVILSGFVLLVATVFVVLQWGSQSSFSLFGPEVQVRTIYFVLVSAAMGVVVWWMARLMVCGAGILWRARREEQKARSEVRRAEKRDVDEGA